MSEFRKSKRRAPQTFNPRAENSWSKDDSKFGQRMLEKMGWKKGEGIGRDGQGVKENIKIRWKLDSKGLGFSIKEDEWVAVEHDFSKLLSDLNKDCSKKKAKKLSLESTSSSSRSRMHYRKFIRGKDISKYSRKDLSGILGRNAEVDDVYDSDHSAIETDNSDPSENKTDDTDHSENRTDDSSGERMKFSGTSDHLNEDENCDLDLKNHKVKKKKVKLDSNLNQTLVVNEIELNGENCDSDSKNYTVKKRKVKLDSNLNQSIVVNEIERNGENCDSDSKNYTVKKRKVKLDSNLNQNLVVNEIEQNGESIECDLEIDSSAPMKKRKKKSVINSTSELEDENQSLPHENQSLPLVEQEKTLPEQCSSSVRKRRKNKIGLKVDDFDYFMQKVTEFNASTDPKAVIEEFEKNKEALLKRYRESFLRNYLESANENDSRIYCDLNGDELDCKNDADKDDCDEADEANVSKKMKKVKRVRERPLTKAERIVLKARLLKAIQSKSCSHNFAGSNLNDIIGYGNGNVSS